MLTFTIVLFVTTICSVYFYTIVHCQHGASPKLYTLQIIIFLELYWIQNCAYDAVFSNANN